MGKMLIRLILMGIAVFISARLIPGIGLTNIWYAFLVALILSVVNVTVKPILQILTLPVTILTLGLFLLVINALMILLVDHFMVNFAVTSFWTAMLFSIVLSIVNWLLDAIFGEDKK
jgi:putative membrane protein